MCMNRCYSCTQMRGVKKNIMKLHLEKRYRKMHHKDVRNGLTKSLANLDTRSHIKKRANTMLCNMHRRDIAHA
jgi:ribosomal protein L29